MIEYLNGNTIKGMSYREELQNTGEEVLRVEKVLIKKGNKGQWARSLVVSDLRSKGNGSRFKSSCYLCVEVTSLQQSSG